MSDCQPISEEQIRPLPKYSLSTFEFDGWELPVEKVGHKWELRESCLTFEGWDTSVVYKPCPRVEYINGRQQIVLDNMKLLPGIIPYHDPNDSTPWYVMSTFKHDFWDVSYLSYDKKSQYEEEKPSFTFESWDTTVVYRPCPRFEIIDDQLHLFNYRIKQLPPYFGSILSPSSVSDESETSKKVDDDSDQSWSCTIM